MTNKIEQKITSYKVVNKDGPIVNVDFMNEAIKRPEILVGHTYKIKPPNSEHALYITINDVILNGDTEHEERRPYEIFINSKNMDHFQWVVALTRLISAVFRKGGDACFLVEEMKAVFDPRGGYFKKGGVFMPSLVAEIGCAIESHLKHIGMIVVEAIPEHQQMILDEKRQQFNEKHGDSKDNGGFPDKATLCAKCNVKAVVMLDNCATCLNCSDSKCG